MGLTEAVDILPRGQGFASSIPPRCLAWRPASTLICDRAWCAGGRGRSQPRHQLAAGRAGVDRAARRRNRRRNGLLICSYQEERAGRGGCRKTISACASIHSSMGPRPAKLSINQLLYGVCALVDGVDRRFGGRCAECCVRTTHRVIGLGPIPGSALRLTFFDCGGGGGHAAQLPDPGQYFGCFFGCHNFFSVFSAAGFPGGSVDLLSTGIASLMR